MDISCASTNLTINPVGEVLDTRRIVELYARQATLPVLVMPRLCAGGPLRLGAVMLVYMGKLGI